MATFNLGKERDDLEAPILMPDDWYTFGITEDVIQKKNAKWKDGGEKLPAKNIPGAGKNLVIKGRIISDEPEYNGRSFTKWLALPNPSDQDEFMNNGQPKADWKLEQIYKWTEAFGGTIEGSEISLAKGMKAQIYISQEADRNDSSELVNAIGFVDPKPLGTGNPLDDDLLSNEPSF